MSMTSMLTAITTLTANNIFTPVGLVTCICLLTITWFNIKQARQYRTFYNIVYILLWWLIGWLIIMSQESIVYHFGMLVDFIKSHMR